MQRNKLFLPWPAFPKTGTSKLVQVRGIEVDFNLWCFGRSVPVSAEINLPTEGCRLWLDAHSHATNMTNSRR